MNMNIKKLYNESLKGTITKEKFLYEVRRNSILGKFVTGLTSYNDAVKILMNKGFIVKESHDANTNWLESFIEAIDSMDITPAAYQTVMQSISSEADLIDTYQGMSPQQAASAFVDDVIGNFQQQAQDDFLNEKPKNKLPFEPGIDHFGNEIEDDSEEEPLPPNWDGEEESEYSGDDEMPTDYGNIDDYNDGEFWESKQHLQEGKQEILTIDQVNPYLYKKGLEYELDSLYNSISFADLSPENIEKVKNKVLKNLSKDPYYYHNKITGQKVTKGNFGEELKEKNTVDKDNQLEKVKKQKPMKANVKDTLGKKEAGKSTVKIKMMKDPGTKMRKFSLKEMIEFNPVNEVSYSKDERVEMLEDAQDLINQAIGLISDAVKGTGSQRSADAYIISHLDNWANGGNPYDQTIPVLIEELMEDEGEEELDEIGDSTDPNVINKKRNYDKAEEEYLKAQLDAKKRSK